MAIRYTPEELKHLRESPLSAIKPPGLPPAEQWMGPKPPADTTRNSTGTLETTKGRESNVLLDQTNKRPQHISRGSANPEDIILGPPKMAFMSSTSIRSAGKPLDLLDRATSRESGSRDRFNFGSLRRDTENEQARDGRGGLPRSKHEAGESDNDGWSTVKPRKSFGTEGAERFNGRMGLDRHRDDRRFKDRDDRELKERPQRGFDTFSRDKDGDQDQERDTRRNGVGRGRNESWFRTDGDGHTTARDRNSNGDKVVDRSRGWREKDRDSRPVERNDRHDRGDRKWDRERDQRQEREPEWMDEPAEERNQAHTQEDFQKWKEQMQGKDKSSGAMPLAEERGDAGGFFAVDKPKLDTALTLDTGPDKFFGMWATPKDDSGIDSGIVREGSAKPQASGKASRFTSFFTPQEEPSRPQIESHPPAPAPSEGLGALFQNAAPDPREKAAFAELLQKLKGNSLGEPTPPPGIPQQQAKPLEMLQGNLIASPEPPQQYRPGNPEETRPTTRNSQSSIQSLLSQRQGAGSQPTIRPEQMLHELVGQRQNALSQSSSRPEQPQSRSNTEFLMNLMQSAKAAPEPPRTEQLLMRMPPPGQKPGDRQMQQQMMEAEMQREAAAQRERSASQRQARPPPPPGFFEDPAAFQRGPPPQHERQPQPTQILQRPPPPGLEQVPPSWSQPNIPVHPPQQLRPHIAPPPGLGAGGPEMRNRGMPPPPMQQQMFPPGFMPPGLSGFQGAEPMGPPRMQPPLGFYAPPPGFIPSGVNGGFQGPEGMVFGGPFDGRGPPPPQGAFRRQ